MIRLFLLITTCIIAFSLTDAQGKQQTGQTDPFRHPFANPVDQPDLPRVLIIGDSISIGYTPGVRRLLDGKANVHRPPQNCRWSAYGDEQIENWIGDAAWDVIHFNFGLWDWYGWAQEVKATPKSYAASLDRIVTKMKKTNAKLIFGMTTPPCVGPERKVKFVVTEERANVFNDAARAVMDKHGVQVNDLYAVIGENRAKYQRGENDVHYTEAGRDVLAAAVAKAIGEVLPDARSASKPGQPPNIILIMADDLGYAELGGYGQEKIRTPNIDRLAAAGMRFTQFYAGSAVCAPSRCNLLTGRHGGHAYIRNNGELKNAAPGRFGGQTPLPESMPTIAKTLKAAGYVTGCFGKWGLGPQGSTGDPLRQGFDRFYGYNCQRNAHNLYPTYLEDDDRIHELEGNTRGRTGKHYAPQLIADRMMDFVRENKETPFFLYYPTALPHLPLQVPEEDLAQYRGQWPEKPYKAGSYQSHETPRACYAAMISFMDSQVGRLMSLLDDLDLTENTVLLFTSDNGASHLKPQVDVAFFDSVGPLRGLKGQLYEGGIRVPLVVRWPDRIAPGGSSAQIAAQYDLPSTLAQLAGVEFDRSSDGLSLMPLLLGKEAEQEKHEFLFWDFAGYGGQIAVRMGKWKGIKTKLKKNPDAPLELYNLDNDIGEKNNIAAAHPDIAEKIESIMLNERIPPEVPGFRFGKYLTK